MPASIPILLETSLPSASVASVPDSSGIQFDVYIYSTSGLTASYTRSLNRVMRDEVVKAGWAYDRVGGAGIGYAEIQGGLIDLDDAVKSEWEIEFRRAGTTWHRGRIVDYTHFSNRKGEILTRITVEGYVTKLSDIRVNRSWTSKTVKQIITDILDLDIKPNTRIDYAAGDIVGAYTVNSISFNCDALHAIQVLATLQGSTEWGVTEATAPKMYFVAEDATGISITAQVIMGAETPRMSARGSFQGGVNQVFVVGGYSAGAVITATGDDTVNQTTYGTRTRIVHESSLLNSSDAERYGDNLAVVHGSGGGYLDGVRENPSSRLEPDRTSGANVGATRCQFRGVDGTVQTVTWNRVAYAYERRGRAYSFHARVEAGFPEEGLESYIRRLKGQVESLMAMTQQTAALLANAGIDQFSTQFWRRRG